jgi:hypothetical protein
MSEMDSTRDRPQKVPDDTSTPKFRLGTYRLIEDVERLSWYCPGGYYPVRIGERFAASRYHVVHKLGYGVSSTI